MDKPSLNLFKAMGSWERNTATNVICIIEMTPGIMQTLQNNSIKMTLRNYEAFDRMRLFPMEQYAIHQPSLYNPQPIVKVTLTGETKYAIKVRIEKIDNIKMSVENNRWEKTENFGTDTSVNILDIGTKHGKDWRDISIQVIMTLTNLSLPIIENTARLETHLLYQPVICIHEIFPGIDGLEVLSNPTEFKFDCLKFIAVPYYQNPAYCIFCYNVRRGIDQAANVRNENPYETRRRSNTSGNPRAKNPSRGAWKKSPTVPGFEEHLKKIISDLKNPVEIVVEKAQKVINVVPMIQNQYFPVEASGNQQEVHQTTNNQDENSQGSGNQQVTSPITDNQFDAHQFVANQFGNEQSADNYAVIDLTAEHHPEVVVIDGNEYEVLQPVKNFVQNPDDCTDMDVIVSDQGGVHELAVNQNGANQATGNQNNVCQVVENVDGFYEMDKKFDEWVSLYKAQVKNVYHPTVVFKFP